MLDLLQEFGPHEFTRGVRILRGAGRFRTQATVIYQIVEVFKAESIELHEKALLVEQKFAQ